MTHPIAPSGARAAFENPSEAERGAPRAGRAGSLVLLLAAAALAVAALAWWSARRQARGPQGSPTNSPTAADPSGAASVDTQTQRSRELAAAHFAQDSIGQAAEDLKPLVDRPDAQATDLISAAVVALRQGKVDEAKALLVRAERAGNATPELLYNQARVAYWEHEYARARTLLERVLADQPRDVPTKLLLALVISEGVNEHGGSNEAAEAQYREVVAMGPDAGLSWYATAVYNLGQLLFQSGREDEAAPYFVETDALRERGVKAPNAAQAEEGNLGRVARPSPIGNRAAGGGALPTFEDAIAVVPELAGARELALVDVDDDCKLDCLAWGPGGLVLAQQGPGFAWLARVLQPGPIDWAVALDVDNDPDGDVDVVYSQGGRAQLLRAHRNGPLNEKREESGPVEWMAWERELPALAGPPSAGVALDFDHEGDLDVLWVGPFGVRLWRNDGAGSDAPPGAFSDVTQEAGLSLDTPFAWCVSEDFDGDSDVDVLCGDGRGMVLFDNLRGGRFGKLPERVRELGGSAVAPLVADLDGDARPDLWTPQWQATGSPTFAFRRETKHAHAGLAALKDPQSLDIDLDGSADVVGREGTGARGLLSARLAEEVPFELEFGADRELVALRFADLDGDLANDALALTAEGLLVRRGHQSGRAVRLFYRGKKDNRQAVGAILELRAGEAYRRVYARGRPELFGVGLAEQVDYVRVLWPAGIEQYDLRRALVDRACDKDDTNAFQPSGLAGSCPFLYTWDGARYRFISDVLGITPLGLPMAPGMLVPPDHDEYVLVRGEQMAPKDGFFELQFTEELREVTYLDRIRLDVLDHPADTEVQPNERFCFPPFPEAMIHSARELEPPVRAVGSDGVDWTQALASVDDLYAAPFTPQPPQMLGLATPHFLELSFDPQRTRDATKLRLFMTGWFYWTDASVNMAAARDPRYEFVPPLLQVPDGAGGWRDAGPPVGFPAGKTKTMVVDVSNLLDRADPRLRVFSTLRLYWDSIRLAVDDGSDPVTVHVLEPAGATLWRRGFSAPQAAPDAYQPERFDWDRLAIQPRWNPHPGRYTRLGECLPLVTEVDDRFVIMASGDALAVRFDARELPELPAGWRRDYLVFLDGWAKDRDPNTVDALYVEPLPFHGMSGYPYGPDEHFPDDEEHRRWRREWNTRDAQLWIPFQAPPLQPTQSPAAPN